MRRERRGYRPGDFIAFLLAGTVCLATAPPALARDAATGAEDEVSRGLNGSPTREIFLLRPGDFRFAEGVEFPARRSGEEKWVLIPRGEKIPEVGEFKRTYASRLQRDITSSSRARR